MKKIFTLCLILKEDHILLGMKKRGFGEGHWNGFGGKVEQGESIEDGAKREIHEESGLTATSIEKVGILDFTFKSDPAKLMEVHIFKVIDFTGEPIESDEMKPQWFKTQDIPYDHMWSDDEQWLPLLLNGKKFRGAFLFDRPSDATYSAQILEQTLTEVMNLKS